MNRKDPQVYIEGLQNRFKQNPDVKKKRLPQINRTVEKEKGVILATIAAEELHFFS